MSSVTIDSASIADAAARADWSDSGVGLRDLQQLFAMVRAIADLTAAERVALSEPDPPRAPDWNVGRFDTAAVATMKQRLLAGQVVAVRVPVTVKPKSGGLQHSHFDFFLQQDKDLSLPEDHFIRQGITISKISSLKEAGFRALVVVEDKPLSTLLGDAENPAHTDWLEKEKKLKERYEWGPFTVRFVRHAPHRIVAELLREPEGRDEELLRDIFFLEVEAEDGRDVMRARGQKKKLGPSGPPSGLQPRVSPVLVQKTSDGFRIRNNPASSVRPRRVKTKVAYQVRRGNPFKKYSTFDFALDRDPISIASVGATVEPEGNSLAIAIESDEFLVEVTGFDAHRDLTIDVKPEVDDAEAIQLHGSEEDQEVGDPVDTDPAGQ